MEDEEARRPQGERKAPDSTESPTSAGDVERRVPAEIRNVSFPAAVRGYDRRAVDAYVSKVNRLTAELQVSSSPRAAVRHALEQAGQQVSGLLEQARQTAEAIAASGRQEAEEHLARAKAEAAELLVDTSVEADRLRAEAEASVDRAREEADAIRAQARFEAEETLTQAREQAEQRRRELLLELAALQEQAETSLAELREETETIRTRRNDVIADVAALANRLADLARTADAGEQEEQEDLPHSPAEQPGTEEAHSPAAPSGEAADGNSGVAPTP